ncbi:cytochrome P450 20A1-like isoform X1 [Tubulanus polymorphus]|uniref:cytochrome P450 20A1-like isoform X1 n=1 Tax=Tubulanus polymorphus TaxID=672921 RepID=UPI003DA3595B
MLDLTVIVATTLVAVLIMFIIRLSYKQKKCTHIPGVEPSDRKEGNLSDIKKAGSLHEFLLERHKTYGPIISFWMGEKMTVSISSPELFSEHSSSYDHPPDLYGLFEPLMGSTSMHVSDGDETRRRKRFYDPCLSHEEVNQFYPVFNTIVQEMIDEWTTLADGQHINVADHMALIVLKSVTRCNFGDYFSDQKSITTFKNNYDICWTEMENVISATPSKPGSPEEKRYKLALKNLKSVIHEIIANRRKNSPTDDKWRLIDAILEANDGDEESIAGDAMTLLIGGFHTTGFMMTWALYYLAIHTEVQDRLLNEVSKTFDKDEVMTPDMIAQMPYLQQVVNETLRYSAVAPWAARYDKYSDIYLGGYLIPKGTSVIQAFGVCFQDEKLYPQPHKFDPDRFSKEQVKTRPPHAFEPFGFAGKRKCLGYRFSNYESYVFLARIVRKFELKIVPGQIIRPVYGLVTHPDKDINITISERKE